MARLPSEDATWQQTNIERRAGLRRMRVAATALLVLMLAMFAACWKFEHQVPELAYLRAFAEAGMVGACADWFAVVALFRHPLRLPIPHTAILPRNKQRIADALGGFFARHFFNSTEIGTRLERIDIAGWLAAWLRSPENVHILAGWLRNLLPPTIELLGTSQLRGASREIIKNGIDSIAVAPLAGRLLAVLMSQEKHLAAFDYGIDSAIEFIGKNKPTFRQRVAEKAPGWVRGWVDARLAESFVDGLLDTLSAARSPNHPWRAEYADFLEGWITRLAQDPDIYEECERIKEGVLDTKLVDDYLAWLAAETESKLKLDMQAESTVFEAALERILIAAGQWMDGSGSIRDAINQSARQLVMSTVVPHRQEIATYISDVVARWDNETLVERLELTVGRDLQFIRINGTLVGGLVGLVLYTITRLLG